jgi:hypothetical protein
MARPVSPFRTSTIVCKHTTRVSVIGASSRLRNWVYAALVSLRTDDFTGVTRVGGFFSGSHCRVPLISVGVNWSTALLVGRNGYTLRNVQAGKISTEGPELALRFLNRQVSIPKSLDILNKHN